MEIRCKNCQKIYFVDANKIPKTGKVFLKCKNCGEKVEIQRKIPSNTLEPQQTNYSRSIEYFEPGSKTALIYCQEIQALKEIEKRLNDLAYQVRIIKNQDDARHFFRFNIFDLVILYQHGPDPDENLIDILKYIHQMPPDIRRNCLVTYVYMSGNKYDLFDAFSRGVDMCINPLDIGEFDKLIPLLIEQKNNNYKVFFDCKRKVEETLV